MNGSDRELLRQEVDRRVRERIAKAHGLASEPWTDDPGYVPPKRPEPAPNPDPLAWIEDARRKAGLA